MQETTVQGFRLSPQQLRLWKLLGRAASTAWRWHVLLRLEGDLDRQALEAALRRVTDRHEILRTSFSCPPGIGLPLQVVQESGAPWIEEWTGAPAPGSLPLFDPIGSGAVRARLRQLGELQHELLLDLPALCADGMTLENLAAELLRACAGVESEAPLQYADIAEWQNHILEAEETADGVALWRELWQERGISTQLALRLPFEDGPAGTAFNPAVFTVPLDAALAGAVEGLAQRQGVPPETVFLTIWQVLLWKSTGWPETLLGVLHHGRHHAELREALGPLARYLPLHIHLEPEMRLGDLLALTRRSVDEADLRQEYFSWDHVAGNGGSTEPLFFPVCFEATSPPPELAADGLRVSLVWRQGLVDRFKLALSCEVSPGEVRLALRHDRGLVSTEAAGRLAERLTTLLRQAVERPQALLDELDPLSETERRQLDRLGRSPLPSATEECLHQAFERQARRTPDHPAVVWQGIEVTFRELDERANRLAHRLRALGAGPEVLVALCLDRSADAVAAVLGILKSGAAYVPLDPTHPRERLAFILENTGAPLLISERRLAAALPAVGVRTILLDEESEAIAACPASAPPASGALPRNLAYAIYTSGSMGTPKGVLIEHRSPLNLLAGLEAAVLGHREGPLRASLNAPLIFDASMQQIALLLAGHTLYVVPEEVRTDGEALLAFVRGERLDLFDCTPSQLRLLLVAGLLDGGPAPEIVLTAGEVVDEGMWENLARSTRTAFFNIYGPTEATVDATWHHVGSAPGGPTIGRPLAGYEVHVLDRGLRRVPIGASGELCIGGPGLARGYAGRPDLTADRFRPHPFGLLPGERLYRSGDLGRHRPEGDLEFLGRIDHQVKVRGYRIELGEIETALAAHSWVLEAVADVRRSSAGDPVLAAWVRLRPEAPAEIAALRPALQEHLRDRLPPYMVPTAFGIVETFPLNPSGKVSRHALPDPGPGRSAAGYVRPRNPVEQLLAAIWEEVLETGPVGINDNFFDLGGHSLIATKVISRVRNALHVELPVRLAFERPTVAELAAAVQSLARTDAPPLVPMLRDGDLPLSFAQQRLWFLQQLEPGSAAYNTPFAVRLAGRLHVPALAYAVDGLVRRQEVLRTTFVVEEGRPRQVISPPASQLLPVADLALLAAPVAEREARRLAAEEASAPFDLSRPPVFRIRLLRLSETDHVLLLTIHHVRGDGWSVGVLAREISELYTAAVEGRAPDLHELPVQYADYARWQRDWLQGPVLDAQLQYWRNRLSGAPGMLELPTDRPRPPVPAFRGGREERVLSAELTRALDQLSRQHGTTPFMTVLAGFAALLHRYADQGTVVIGSPIAQRTRAEIEGLIGFFANTLPMRLDLGDDPSFRELLGRARETALGAYAHQDLPFEKLVEELRPERDLRHAPIFQAMLVFQSQPAEPLRLADLEARPFGEGAVVARFDLTLSCFESLGRLVFILDYDADLFEAATAVRMLRLLEHLLEGASAQPTTAVSELPLLDEEEREQVLAAWTTPPPDLATDATLHRLFEEQAARAPEAPALLFANETVTFGKLDRWANQLARRLLRMGVAPEARVGLCLDRSPAAIASMLGILKAGGAYVPLDPESPRERLAALARDADLAALVTQERLAPSLAGLAPQTMVLDAGSPLAGESEDAVSVSGFSENVAYVIYTSGSTGASKGVAVSHGAVAGFVRGFADALGVSPGDRLLLFAPLSFDASVLQIFVPLACGAALAIHPNPRELAGSGLLSFCEQSGVTVLDLPAALWRRWIEDMTALRVPPPAGLCAFLTGGESVPVEKLREWARWVGRPAAFFSSYGPTEATVTSMLFRAGTGEAAALPWGKLPLGRPLRGVRVCLLDRHQRPVPRGVPGEIHLAGTGLARGYLGRPELTAEAFRPDPFATEPGARLYRTGDVARHRPGGSLEFLGRADHQVKIRGFRLELAEVEAALAGHPAVQEAVVLLRTDRLDEQRLAAYVTVRERSGTPAAAELRAFLAERLPQFMVPSAYVVLTTLPVLPSGKVDRNALPAPDAAEASGQAAGCEKVAPRTAEEQLLADLWAQVLGIAEVGVFDNFFELGGDSILSIQIVARANRAGLHLRVRDLFEHQTVAELARVAQPPTTMDAEQGTVHGPVPLTAIQLWFVEEGFAEPHHFNQAILLEVRQPLSLQALEWAVATLFAHHDALRLRLVHDGERWSQINAAEEPATPFVQVDLSALPEPRQPGEADAVAARLQTGFDLARGPLARLALLHLSPSLSDRLLWAAHHLAVDGVSWRVLLEDLEAAYNAAAGGRDPALPAKTTSFRSWAERLVAYSHSPELTRESGYWRAVARSSSPRLPLDFPEGLKENTVGSGQAIVVSLTSEETGKLLREIPSLYRTQIQEVLLGALGFALAGWTGGGDLHVDLEGHGREPLFDDMDLTRTVGWFTTQYPVLLPGEASDPVAALARTKGRLRQVPSRGIGYGLLHYLGGGETARELAAAPRAEVSFNYLGQLDGMAGDSDSPFAATAASTGPQRSLRSHRTHLLEVSSSVMGGQLYLRFVFNRNVHRRKTVERVAAACVSALRELIERSRAAASAALAPSDFPLARLDEGIFSRLAKLLGAALVETEDVYPLSPLQQGLLFHSLLEPGSGVYVNQCSCTLRGDLSPTLFRRTWQELLDRHAILRTAFLWEGLEEPLQAVLRRVEVPWEELDWRGVAATDQEERLEGLLAAERLRPLPLDRAPLLRFLLVRLSDNAWELVWTFHHLLLDGWSTPLLLRDVFAIYRALLTGESAGLPEPRPFRDYIAWLQRQDPDTAEPFWRRSLAGLTSPTPLVIDQPRRTADAAGTAESLGRVPAAAVIALQALASRHKITLGTLATGAWALLLGRYNREEDVLFGTVVSGRPAALPEVESIIGLFINTLPVRVRIPPGAPWLAWLRDLQAAQVELRQYEHSPLAQVQRWSDMPAGTPLFESLFAFENYPVGEARGEAGGTLRIEDVRAAESTNYPLTLAAGAVDGHLFLRATWDRSRFDEDAIERLLGHLESLLTAMAAEPEVPLSGLPLLRATERRELILLAAPHGAPFPAQPPVHLLCAQAAANDPEAVALVAGARRLTYAELHREADQLARRLRRLGVGPESRVAVCLERSPELVTALLAVLKAGGAYVPLDPEYPSDRLAFLLGDSAARVLVTQEGLRKRLPAAAEGLRTLCLDIAGEESSDESSEPLEAAEVDPANTAYVIYTSGSTGRPKGVAVPHGAVTRLLTATAPWFGFGPKDVWTLFHSCAFDFSVWEIWGALAHGGRLVIVPWWVSRSPATFRRLLVDERVTVLNQTPSAFRQLQQADEEAGGDDGLALRWVIFGGEALDLPGLVPWIRRHGDDRPRLINMYGITETTVHATYRRIRDADVETAAGSVIGEPIPDLRLHVLDGVLEPAPRLVPGEICVGGAGLARGYLGRPELTAERFIPDPFGLEAGARLYRSGDLARLLPDGDLQYLGRIDHQVKIRGFRIELGEIEAALGEHPAIRASAVLARDEKGGHRQLVAYVVGSPLPHSTELRAFLADRLPDYMVPALFVPLDELPRTANGKLDRRSLPEPAADRSGLGVLFVPPAGPVEEALADIWSEVLGAGRVGRDDNFFVLGGDSILSLRILSLARERNLHLTLQQIFQHPTLRELAGAVGRVPEAPPALWAIPFGLLSETDRGRLPKDVEDAYPLTSLQAGMLFHTQLSPKSAVYHDIFSSHLEAPFDAGLLRRSVARATARHPVLRTSFDLVSFSEPLQLIHRAVEPPLAIEDLRHLDRAGQEACLAAWKQEEKRRPFVWGQAPLLRLQVHLRSSETFQLSIAFHHAILDGWSFASLLSELFRDYLALCRGEEPPATPDLPTSFREFVALEREALHSPESQRYWARVLSGGSPGLPRLHRGVLEGEEATGVLETPLAPSLSAALHDVARAAGVPLKNVLLAAHARVLAALSGSAEVVTGLVSSGRPEGEEGGERVLGLFLNTLPLRLSLRGGTWWDLVRHTYESESEMLAHRRYPMAELQRAHGGRPLFEAAFNFVHFHIYQGLAGTTGIQALDQEFFEQTSFTFLANFSQDPFTGQLQLRLEYDAGSFPAEQIRETGGLYARALAALAAAPGARYEAFSPLTEAERRQTLEEWNRPEPAVPGLPCRVPLHRLFEAAADRRPEAPAVTFDGRHLSYGELERRANQLARALRRVGVGPEVRVGLAAERSPDLLVGILGILKAGGAYVALDPEVPRDRLAFLLRDAGIRVLLTQSALVERLSLAEGLPVLLLDGLEADAESDERPAVAVDPDNAAYVIYTSGSTGIPKGVIVRHTEVASLLAATRSGFGFGEDDVWTLFHSYAFDFSVWEIWGAFAHGGRLVVVPFAATRDPEAFLDLLASEEVTVLNQTPSAFRQLAAADLSRADPPTLPLRWVIFGGEALDFPALASWFERHGDERPRLVNMYGITETTVHVTWRPIAASDLTRETGSVIGRPIPDLRAYLLDPHLEPAPPLVPGEICVGGDGLARGYLERPELTAERFIPDPFVALAGTRGGRLYRSGDLARWLPGGDLEYLGRSDQQIKIRGFRIEPGEIQAALEAHPSVRVSVVVAREERKGDQRLIAYVVPAADEVPDAAALRRHLHQRLPDYMVPSAFVPLAQLPLTANGKLDRRALPAPDAERTEREHVAPRTPTEETLATIWAQVLAVPRVGAHDNFFELGGHSLLATQIMLRVNEAFGVDLPLRQLYEAADLQQLAEAVVQARAADVDAELLARMLDEVEHLDTGGLDTFLAIDTPLETAGE